MSKSARLSIQKVSTNFGKETLEVVAKPTEDTNEFIFDFDGTKDDGSHGTRTCTNVPAEEMVRFAREILVLANENTDKEAPEGQDVKGPLYESEVITGDDTPLVINNNYYGDVHYHG